MSWLISGRHMKKQSPPCHLGILAFETAKAMSRLVSLYHSLSDTETRRLQSDLSSSTALSRLTSPDHHHLLFLAAAERLSDLNSSAATASRLSLRCSDPSLVRFDLVYADLKLGLIDPTRKKLEFGSKTVVRIVEKMSRLAGATARLYSAMEALARLELSERKIDTRRRNSPDSKRVERTTDLGLYRDKIDFVRKEVERLREVSLWKATYDKTVGLMARIVCVVYVRIFVVFGPSMDKNYTDSINNNINCMRNDINDINNNNNNIKGKNYSCLLEDRTFHQRNRKWESKSGPLAGKNKGTVSVSTAVAAMEARMNGSGSEVWRLAGPATVGGAGMTSRYAAVIVAAERCMVAPETVTEEARAGLYDMLTWSLRREVARKKRSMKADVAEEMMTWLGPVAHDTLLWQAERNMERQRCDFEGERVLLVQTLHFSDLDKTEAAISDVLVGLSRLFESQDNHVGRCHRRQCRKILTENKILLCDAS